MTLRSLAMLLAAAITTLGAFGAVSSPAMAGGSLKDEPVVEARGGCTGGKFGGAYIGANIGYARHQDDKLDVNPLASGNSFGDTDGGVAGGLYYGYNVQCDRMVFGIESDIGFLDTNTSQTDPCCATITTESDINWYSTSRLRVGIVHDNRMMFFVTAGLAVADVDHKISDPLIIPGGFSETHGDKQWGWTAGAGVDLLRDDRWMLRLEALYVDLGSETETYTVTGCGIGTCSTSYKWEDDFWVARLGISYKFGAREEAVVPLK